MCVKLRAFIKRIAFLFRYLPHYMYISILLQPSNEFLMQVKVKTIVMVAEPQRRSVYVTSVVRKNET